MATVDDKVVAMSFESSKFESGVNKTIAALDKLKHALSFPSAGKGLEAINSEAEKVNLSHIGNAVDGIKHKFSALSIVGITALANIVSRAVSSGISLVKAFTIDPIKAGFKNYGNSDQRGSGRFLPTPDSRVRQAWTRSTRH